MKNKKSNIEDIIDWKNNNLLEIQSYGIDNQSDDTFKNIYTLDWIYKMAKTFAPESASLMEEVQKEKMGFFDSMTPSRFVDVGQLVENFDVKVSNFQEDYNTKGILQLMYKDDKGEIQTITVKKPEDSGFAEKATYQKELKPPKPPSSPAMGMQKIGYLR